MSRQNDERIEKEVGKFMDENFWNKTKREYIRTDDAALQYRGCDLSAGNLIIDEKVKYYNCLNDFLKYPSFEIITNDRYGNASNGWFIKKDSMTNTYMFISIGT